MADNDRGVLLRNPVLGVCANETPDDEEARQLIEQLINEVDASICLKVVKEKPNGRSTPWLRSSLSIFRGLQAIKDFAIQERMFHT